VKEKDRILKIAEQNNIRPSTASANSNKNNYE